jgi:transcription elongation factor Elf1
MIIHGLSLKNKFISPIKNSSMNQSNVQRPSGFECPVCKGFIPVSITDLIQQKTLTCPICSLQLDINRHASQKAIDALEKVQQAQENVDKASVFRK